MGFEFKLEIPESVTLSPGEEQGRIFDVAILGGGPAGMTAAIYVLRKQLKTIMIAPDLGGQVLWTSGIENYMGYQYITGPELAMKFSEQIQQFPLKLLRYESGTRVFQTEDQSFRLQTDSGREINSRTLILATGKRPRKLHIPGEEKYIGKGVSFCAICDAPFFKQQPVAIVGGGNSAFTAAIDLLAQDSPVTMINASVGWQADPVLQQQIQGKAELLDEHQIQAILGDGQKVTGVDIISRQNGVQRHLPVAGVFVEIGLDPNTEIFRDLVDLNSRREVIIDCSAHTSRPGVYAAGDCTSVPDKQIIIAAGEGAKAALTAYRYLKNIS